MVKMSGVHRTLSGQSYLFLMASLTLLCFLSFSHCQFVDVDTVNIIGLHWTQLAWPPANQSGCTSAGFTGLFCSADGTHVIRLHLNGLQLNGTIPHQIGSLSSLIELWLDNNTLTGTIPPQLSNLSSLIDFWLFDNQLTGSIPPQLGNIPTLGSLRLHNNLLSGSIPPQLGDAPSLKYIYLQNNTLTGSIPSALGNHPGIVYLNLNNNQLTGTIPSALGSLSSLTELYLQDNQLTGTIPPQLGNLSSLIVIYAYDNQLTGSIPPQLGSLSTLKYVDLNNNRLTGTIPPQFGNLPSLQSIRVYCNQYLDICSTIITKTFSASCRLDAPLNRTGCQTDWNANGCTLSDTSSCNFPPPIAPTEPPTPIPTEEPITPTEPPRACNSNPPQPVESFICVGGQWMSNKSVEAPNIKVSGQTMIAGNLTIDNTITFHGLGSSINVSGCIALGDGGVVVNLSEEDIEELSKNEGSNRFKQLLQQNSSCSNDLTITSIQTSAPKSCKRVSATRSDVSTPASLSVVFKVDANHCRIWWIILASVLGGVILIVIIVVFLFQRQLRAKRSNSKSTKHRQVGE